MSDVSYEDQQRARDREYLEAWGKLTPEEREAMRAAGVEGPIVERGTERPDYSHSLERMPGEDGRKGGTEAEAIADRFDVPLETAEKILEWHFQHSQADVEGGFARRMDRVIGYLLKPTENLQAVIWGLAFSWGLATRINGASSLSAVARRMGCSRALLSYYKRKWDEVLRSKNRIYGKSEETCRKLSEARRRVVARGTNTRSRR